MPRPAIDKQRLEQFCRRHHIRELSLFGSTLEGTAAPDSDAGLPAKCETGREPDLNVLVSWGHEPSAANVSSSFPATHGGVGPGLTAAAGGQ